MLYAYYRLSQDECQPCNKSAKLTEDFCDQIRACTLAAYRKSYDFQKLDHLEPEFHDLHASHDP